MDLNKIKQSALDFLADMPIAKAIGGVISNPTPQEVGQQVYNTASSVNSQMDEQFGKSANPMDMALNYGSGAIGGTIKKVGSKIITPIVQESLYNEANAIDAFHGTTSAFTEFKKGMTGKNTGASSAKEGFWFVNNPKVAESYATYSAETWPVKKLLEDADTYERIAQKTNSQKWWDKYDLALQQAEELELKIKQDNFRGQNVIPVKLYMKNPAVMDAKGATYFDTENSITDFIKTAKKSGNDGVIIKNLDDAATYNNMPADHYMVFDSNQIKSKFNKTPTISPNMLKSVVVGLGVGTTGISAEKFLEE